MKQNYTEIMDFANIFTEFTVKKLKTFYYKELKGVRRSYRSFCSLGKLEANGSTDGAARGEPSLLELSRVVTEEDEVKIEPMKQREENQTYLSYAEVKPKIDEGNSFANESRAKLV